MYIYIYISQTETRYQHGTNHYFQVLDEKQLGTILILAKEDEHLKIPIGEYNANVVKAIQFIK